MKNEIGSSRVIIVSVLFVLLICFSLVGCNTSAPAQGSAQPAQTEGLAQDSGAPAQSSGQAEAPARGSIQTAPEPANGSSEASGKVQPGSWEAAFSISLANGKTENWIVDFFVNDDGKTVSSVELIHYIGELTPDTNATALFTVIDAAIKKNSFDFSLTELVSYSTKTYKGKVTFTSSKEAEGVLNISGDDYGFTAVPFSE